MSRPVSIALVGLGYPSFARGGGEKAFIALCALLLAPIYFGGVTSVISRNLLRSLGSTA